MEWARDGGVDDPPQPGQTASVRLSYPFQGRIGHVFWCHWQPALAAYNGYDDHLEALAEGRLVQLRLTQVEELRIEAQGRPIRPAAGEVCACWRFTELLRLPSSEGSIKELGPIAPNDQAEVAGGLRFSSSNFEGDLGQLDDHP